MKETEDIHAGRPAFRETAKTMRTQALVIGLGKGGGEVTLNQLWLIQENRWVILIQRINQILPFPVLIL